MTKIFKVITCAKIFIILIFYIVHNIQPIFCRDLTSDTIGGNGTNITSEDWDEYNITTSITTVSPTEDFFPPCYLPVLSEVDHTSSSECKPCTCNTRDDICEVNCCCDPQCSAQDKQTFSKCLNLISSVNRKKCFQSNVFFALNINSTLIQTSDGLYCVHFFDENEKCFSDFVPVRFDSLFEKLEYKASFLPNNNDMDFGFVNGKWKADQPIIAVIENGNFFILGLPELNNRCSFSGSFLYLLDKEILCQQLIRSSHTCIEKIYFNAATYYEHIEIMTNIRIRVPLEPYLCDTEFENCIKLNSIPSPFFNTSTQSCENVVEKIQYNFFHRGIYGIVKAEAKFIISQQKLNSYFDQTLQLKYIWVTANAETNKKRTKKNGNRGYLLDHPIRAGTLINGTIELDLSGYLRFPSLDDETFCNISQNIHFGENLVFGCDIPIPVTNLTKMCDLLVDITSNLGIMTVDYISSFGNSDLDNTSDWVGLRSYVIQKFTSISSLIPNSAVCENVTLSYHLVLSHAVVGHRALPQSKIVGAHLIHVNSDYVFLCFGVRNCNTKTHNVNIRFAVTFLNVTKT